MTCINVVWCTGWNPEERMLRGNKGNLNKLWILANNISIFFISCNKCVMMTEDIIIEDTGVEYMVKVFPQVFFKSKTALKLKSILNKLNQCNFSHE